MSALFIFGEAYFDNTKKLSASYRKPFSQVFYFRILSFLRLIIIRDSDNSTQQCHSKLSKATGISKGVVQLFDSQEICLLEIRQIRFLGGKLGKALAEEYDVSTVADLL